MVSEASLVSVTVHTRPWSPTMCHDVPAFSSGSRVSISIRTRQPTLPLRCLSHNASQTRLHVCFFPLSLWPPSRLEPLLSVTPLVRQTALHRNPVFPSTISHGAAAVALDTQVWSCDSPVYSSSVASHTSSCEVQGRYKIHKVLPAEMPACISVVFPASLFLLFHTRLVGFFFRVPYLAVISLGSRSLLQPFPLPCSQFPCLGLS